MQQLFGDPPDKEWQEVRPAVVLRVVDACGVDQQIELIDQGSRSSVTVTVSSGLLLGLLRQPSATDPETRYLVFHLAGRPVAQLALETGQPDRWWYLTTDHLGIPLVATDTAGNELWENRFEPFGRDIDQGQPWSALEHEMFLRFPGQWEDTAWQEATMGAGVYYNVHRWYQPSVVRYTRPDPLGLLRPFRDGLITYNLEFTYAANNSLSFVDPLGLKVIVLNPETEQSYERLKDCFPLFRNIADHFENDTWTDFGPDRTWTIKDPDWGPGSCAVGGRRSEPRTIWVPPERDCEGTMRCLFHEFYELWLIRAGGFPASKMGAGPADKQARRFETYIPFERCCPCD